MNMIRARLSDVVRRRQPLSREAGPSTQQPPFSADVRFVFGILRERRRIVMRAVALAFLGALAYIWLTAPLYTSTAQILIDPRKREIVNKEIVPSGLGTSSLGADTFLLDSQVEVMMSERVRRSLIEKLALDKDPEFGGGPRSAIMGAIAYAAKLALRGPQAGTIPDSTNIDRALKFLEQRMQINREGNTYVINVRMTTKDPEKSATIANTMAEIYIKHGIDAARERVTEVETLLQGRLKELKAAAVETQMKVENFRAQNGLIAAEKSTLVEQELRDLNQQLTVSAANTSKALARWKEVGKLQNLSFDDALSAGSIQSPLLATLQDRYAAIVAQEASLASSLKSRHPNLIAVRDSKAAIKREIAAELSRMVSRTKIEYDVAIANEAAIKNRLAAAKAITVETNEAAITLNELEQDAGAAAAIYQEFLSRAKDAREQATLPSDSARVLSVAYPPNRPSWPKEPLLLGFALFGGLVGGIGLAFLLHVLGRPRQVDPKLALSLSQQQTA